MNEVLILVCLCGFLSAVVITMAITQHLERKDLYTRLMSRDLTEYKSTDNYKVPKASKSAHKTTLERWRKVNDIEKGE